MGGCYSAESNKALSSPKHKQPREHVHKYNGHRPLPYTLVSNGATPAVTEPAYSGNTSCVPGRNKTNNCANDKGHRSGSLEDNRGVAPSDSGIESICGVAGEEPAAIQRSDSGDQEDHHPFQLCSSCQQKLQRLSVSSCGKCGQIKVNSSHLSSLVGAETYCTCGPRQLGKSSQCRTHGTRGNGSASTASQRHSDIPISATAQLKSSLRKYDGTENGNAGKKVRMSWKSADSLDLAAAVIASTCLDRAKSEQSEVFGDDVSFRAPLAQFDSVDKRLDSEEAQCDAAVLASRMSIYSELLDLADSICKCDFSVVESSAINHALACEEDPSVDSNLQSLNGADTDCRDNRSTVLSDERGMKVLAGDQVFLDTAEDDDEDSGHGLSKSEGHSLSPSDRDEEELEVAMSLSNGSSPYKYAAASVLESLQDDGTQRQLVGPVSVVVQGRQMVVMDAETFLQMQSDLALLREQLGHLTQIIQEDDLDSAVGPFNLSLAESDA